MAAAVAAAAAAGGGDVKLIGLWSSPYALRPMIAFNLKGVRYQYVEEDFNSNPKSDLLLKSNPVYKKVPVLLHDGRPVCESMIIVNYIDDVWTSPAPLLPADPYDRAIHRFWASYVDDKFFPQAMSILRAQSEEGKRELVEQTYAGLKLLEEAFEKCSKGRGFFNGDGVGYLDISLGSYLAWLRVVEEVNGVQLLDADRTPLLAGWAERFLAHEAVKGVMPENEKLIHYFKTVVVQRWKAAAAAK